MSSALADAQVPPPPQLDDATRPRIRVRGLSLNPTLAITNAGIDGNVFNSAEDPQQDFTMTVTPALNGWVRAGRARLAIRGQGDMLYFRRYASQRSLDGGYGARLEVPINRLSPWFEGGYYTARQRAGYEIDVRSRRKLQAYGAGVNYRIAGKTTVGAGGRFSTTSWNGDAVFFGNSLSQQLNLTSRTAMVTYRQSLTVLTTLVAETGTTIDRFEFAAEKDTDSVYVIGGFDLNTRALINGSGRVGFRKFDTVGGGAQPFRGVVARADLGYVIRGVTRLGVQVERDTNYSFEREYPYYVQTGVSGTVTQRVTGNWDAQARINHQVLAYRPLVGSLTAIADRSDKIDRYGVGVGYRLNQGVRLGFNLDREQRASPHEHREYSGYRFGGSVAYAR